MKSSMSTFDLDEFLPYRLAVLSRSINEDFAIIYGKTFDLTQAEWRVIAHLSQQEKVSIREIHQRVDMGKPKVTRAAQRLEAAGLVAKNTHPVDKRLVELSLTSKGKRLMAKIAPMARKYQASVLDKLPADQRAALDQALDTLTGQ